MRDYINVHITKREQECANLIALGYSNKEIGNIMYCSVGTVKAHISSLLRKTNSKNKTNLVHNLHKIGFYFN